MPHTVVDKETVQAIQAELLREVFTIYFRVIKRTVVRADALAADADSVHHRNDKHGFSPLPQLLLSALKVFSLPFSTPPVP